MYLPSYLQYEHHELRSRVREAYALVESCVLCPRRCGVRRSHGELGFCRSATKPVIASRNTHFGEEPPVSGSRGSGTIFFTNCNLRCRYCQNYPISQLGTGREISPNDLAETMMWVQSRECHNLNLVTPTHWVPQILEALCLAVEKGFRLPLVYNSNGYDSLETLRLLDRIVDIYIPDMKYHTDAIAQNLSGVSGYCAANRAAVLEMARQVPDYQVDNMGILKRGLIIRHLVLPAHNSETEEIFRFIASRLPDQTRVSLMTQYFPAHRAVGDKVLGRRINRKEYLRAKKALEEAGLQRGWCQVPNF